MEEIVKEVKIGGSLDYSNHALVEFMTLGSCEPDKE